MRKKLKKVRTRVHTWVEKNEKKVKGSFGLSPMLYNMKDGLINGLSLFFSFRIRTIGDTEVKEGKEGIGKFGLPKSGVPNVINLRTETQLGKTYSKFWEHFRFSDSLFPGICSSLKSTCHPHASRETNYFHLPALLLNLLKFPLNTNGQNWSWILFFVFFFFFSICVSLEFEEFRIGSGINLNFP